MRAGLEQLFAHGGLWRGAGGRSCAATLPTGYAELDACLPGGGWPLGAVTELLVERHGTGELALLLPALARLSRERQLWLAWVGPPYEPYAPALADAGIDLARNLLIRADSERDILWAMEQALGARACVAVLGWVEQASPRMLRRLALAAEHGGAWAVLFRPARALAQASVAALRLRLSAESEGSRLHILKSRGGRPAVLSTSSWLQR